MARRKNSEGVEVEVPDTDAVVETPVVEAAPEVVAEVTAPVVPQITIEDAPLVVAPVVEVAPTEPQLTEQTKAEMAEGRRMLEKRNAEIAAATASRDAAEAAQKSE